MREKHIVHRIIDDPSSPVSSISTGLALYSAVAGCRGPLRLVRSLVVMSGVVVTFGVEI